MVQSEKSLPITAGRVVSAMWIQNGIAAAIRSGSKVSKIGCIMNSRPTCSKVRYSEGRILMGKNG